MMDNKLISVRSDKFQVGMLTPKSEYFEFDCGDGGICHLYVKDDICLSIINGSGAMCGHNTFEVWYPEHREPTADQTVEQINNWIKNYLGSGVL